MQVIALDQLASLRHLVPAVGLVPKAASVVTCLPALVPTRLPLWLPRRRLEEGRTSLLADTCDRGQDNILRSRSQWSLLVEAIVDLDSLLLILSDFVEINEPLVNLA